MAFGFTPKHQEEYYLDNFTSQQFLVLALESARYLNWEIGTVSDGGFIAFLNKKEHKIFAQVTFLIENNQASIISESLGNEMFDWGRNKKNVEQFTDKLVDFKYSLKADVLDQKYQQLLTEEVFCRDNSLLSEARSSSGLLSFFLPREGYMVTPILLIANIIVFAIMIISGVHILNPDGASLLSWGANFRPLTQSGEWWRFITCCFLHFGILHLLMNMYALVYIGLLLEPRIGSGKFAASYLITGVLASITSFWWNDLTISAGASGAIFGMYGLFLALLCTNLIEKATRTPLLISIGVFVMFNLANGMKEGIDNAAHIGGLVGGLIIGFSYYPALIKPELRFRNLAVYFATLLGIAAIALTIIQKTPDTFLKYERVMNEFAQAEEKAMGIYRMPQDAPPEQFVRSIKEEGIPNWNACFKIVSRLDSLSDLPPDLTAKAELLKKYIHYRIITYQLLSETFKLKTNAYDSQINWYVRKIDLIIEKLNGKEIDDKLLNANPLVDFTYGLPKEILYVVDGVPVKNGQEINSDNIVSVIVMAPQDSKPLYGAEGKHGAVLIQTKKFYNLEI